MDVISLWLICAGINTFLTYRAYVLIYYGLHRDFLQVTPVVEEVEVDCLVIGSIILGILAGPLALPASIATLILGKIRYKVTLFDALFGIQPNKKYF